MAAAVARTLCALGGLTALPTLAGEAPAMGLVARETDAEIVLRDDAAGGREIPIQKASIEERVEASASLIPAGLANLLADRRQFVDLVRYLAEVAEGGLDRTAKLAAVPHHGTPVKGALHGTMH